MNRERALLNDLYDSIHRVDELYEEYAARFGLTYAELQLFYAFMEDPGRKITQKDLCSELEAPKTTVNYIIKKFEKKGLLVMESSENDRREKVLRLTEAGEGLAAKSVLPLLKAEEELIAELPQKRLKNAIETLGQFSLELQMKIE